MICIRIIVATYIILYFPPSMDGRMVERIGRRTEERTRGRTYGGTGGRVEGVLFVSRVTLR